MFEVSRRILCKQEVVSSLPLVQGIEGEEKKNLFYSIPRRDHLQSQSLLEEEEFSIVTFGDRRRRLTFSHLFKTPPPLENWPIE